MTVFLIFSLAFSLVFINGWMLTFQDNVEEEARIQKFRAPNDIPEETRMWINKMGQDYFQEYCETLN